MNSTNNSGPKMEPCGTPDKTVILSEAILSRRTLCFLPVDSSQGVSEGCCQYHIAI